MWSPGHSGMITRIKASNFLWKWNVLGQNIACWNPQVFNSGVYLRDLFLNLHWLSSKANSLFYRCWALATSDISNWPVAKPAHLSLLVFVFWLKGAPRNVCITTKHYIRRHKLPASSLSMAGWNFQCKAVTSIQAICFDCLVVGTDLAECWRLSRRYTVIVRRPAIQFWVPDFCRVRRVSVHVDIV